jgi:tetratricopeptide (TPR) repeat protein
LFAILSLATVAWACLWDDDTLSIEAKGLPSVVDAIVGRVAINPPEYYEARIPRSLERLARDPDDYEAYDNLAVAYDKLGQNEKAREILEKKRAQLVAKKVQPTSDPIRDPWYRYHANLGTVLVHEWLLTKPEGTQLLEKGYRELETAVKINPDAHFDREKVQLALVRWLLASSGSPSYPAVTVRGKSWKDLGKEFKGDEVSEGVVGIMALGSGPDNRDLVRALATAQRPSDGHILGLAELRDKDLEAKGKPVLLSDVHFAGYMPRDSKALKAQFEALVKNAEEFRRHRTEYVLARLKEGRHSDDDPRFWDGYKEVPRVDLRSMEPLIPASVSQNAFVFGVAVAVVTLAAMPVVLATILVRRMLARRR